MIEFRWHTATWWDIYKHGIHNAVPENPYSYDLRVGYNDEFNKTIYRAGEWDNQFLETQLIWEKLNAV